jgi:hypothetical protein
MLVLVDFHQEKALDEGDLAVLEYIGFEEYVSVMKICEELLAEKQRFPTFTNRITNKTAEEKVLPLLS